MVLLVGMVCAVVYTLEANSHLAESQLLVHMHRAKVEDDDFQKQVPDECALQLDSRLAVKP